MKALIIFVTFMLSLGIARAQAHDYLNDQAIAKINLDGLRILDDENQDTLLYEFKKASRPSRELKKFIQDQIETQPLSKIWALANPSSFRNILMFVAKRSYSDHYQLFVIFLNPSGSAFVLDYDIVDASPYYLELVNGPSDELLKYKAMGSAPLFP